MSEELLMIPGPTNLHPRVRAVLSGPQLSHGSPQFSRIFREALDLTRQVFRCRDGLPYIISGSGTVGMEVISTSIVEPGDRVLVLETGAFGTRFTMINQSRQAQVTSIASSFGDPVDLGKLEAELAANTYKALFVTHVDTSSTVVNPVRGVGRLAHRYGALAVVDSVCGLGGIPLEFDEWDIDFAMTGSQKAIAAPPGVNLICVSKRGLEAMMNRRTPIGSYYMNLLRWKPVMEDTTVYLSTPATQLIAALREALLMVVEEGLENRWKRHHIIAEALRAGIQSLDYSFIAREGYRADTVTGLYVPEGRAGQIVDALVSKFNIRIAKGLGELSSRVLRIGHMGIISPKDVRYFLTAFEYVTKLIKPDIRPGTALDSAEPYLKSLE